jgi:DNA-binding transcriptional ArsR family regulator
MLNACAHPTRAEVLDMLFARLGQEFTVTEIHTMVNRQQAIISQQLSVLYGAGLIERRKHKTFVMYRFTENTFIIGLFKAIQALSQGVGNGVEK